MYLVSTALYGCLRQNTTNATELGRSQRVGRTKLCQSFHIWKQNDRVYERFVVIDAVQNEAVGLGTQTIC